MRRPLLKLLLLAFVAPIGWGATAVPPGLDPLRAGQAALEDAQYAVAESFFRAALQKAMDRRTEVDARIGLARALQGRNAPREALEMLPADRAPAKGMPAAGPWRYERAQALAALGAWVEALAELDEADAMDSGELPAGETARLRAWIYLQQARWPESDKAYAAWESVAGVTDRVAWVETWARALVATGQWSRAEAAVRRALERGEATAEEVGRLRVLRGQIFLYQGIPDEAEAMWRVVVTSGVSAAVQVDAWLGLAELASRRGQLEEALRAASNAVALAIGPSERRMARKRLGLLLLQQPDPTEGVTLLKTLIADDPQQSDAPTLQLSVARALLNAGRYEEAETQFRVFLESFPDHAQTDEALEGRGWALVQLGRPAEAAEAFEKAAEKSGTPETRRRRLRQAADAWFANRQYQTAAERYRTVAEGPADDPDVRESKLQEAECWVRLNRPTEARRRFEALSMEWGATEWGERAALRAAELWAEEGDLDQGRQAFTRFLESATNRALRARAYYGRGLTLYQQYQFDDAYRDFSKVVESGDDPALTERAAYMQLCAAFERPSNSDAEGLAHTFLVRWPESLWADAVLFRLAETAYTRGAFEEAEQAFAALAARSNAAPDLVGDALYWAARAASAQKEFARSVEYDGRLIRDFPRHSRVGEAIYGQAEALFELGHYERAAALFDETIRRLPGTYLADAALSRKGDCLVNLGTDQPERVEEAIRIYDELAAHTNAVLDLRLQAAFKSGRTRQRLGRNDEAFERYYAGVVLPFLDARRTGLPLNEACVAWFTRAAFEAAALLEAKGRWREAVRLYERVMDSGVPAASEARRRIETIRREHWRWI